MHILGNDRRLRVSIARQRDLLRKIAGQIANPADGQRFARLTCRRKNSRRPRKRANVHAIGRSRIAAKRYVIVFKQPDAAQQESLCREAMECCPVEAIGDDGQ